MLKKETILIVGGGTGGWMTAAMLSRNLDRSLYSIELVESDEIGIIGVGEATIPSINQFNERVGIDFIDFMKETQATIKLGIEFVNWKKVGESYIHPFGAFGPTVGRPDFSEAWFHLNAQGKVGNFEDYSIAAVAARANRFGQLFDKQRQKQGLLFAEHIDASLYARLLRKHSEAAGVTRHEGKITNVNLCEKSGNIASVEMEDGRKLEADFFFDCSGFRSMLLGGALGVGFNDYSHWLPVNSAWAVQTKSPEGPTPNFTRSTAHSAGWQWRIPLQHRVGNGHVFCDRFMDEDTAKQILIDNLEGEMITDPRLIKFTTGYREKFWHKNCVAIGLSSGFLEPLESTAIHVIQVAAAHFVNIFSGSDYAQAEQDDYNEFIRKQYDYVRDLLVMHYKFTERDDSDFWNHVRTMEIPESLQNRLAMFQHNGRIETEQNEVFAKSSWFAVAAGQGFRPTTSTSTTKSLNVDHLEQEFEAARKRFAAVVDTLPTHDQFLEANCRAEESR